MRDSWNKILKFLEKGLNPGLYKVWIKPLKAEISNNTIKLYAPNDFVAAWVRDRLMDNIKEAGAQVLGVDPKVEIGVKKAAEKPVLKAKPAVARPVQARMGLPMMSPPVVSTRIPRWRFSFDDFVVGESNQLACAASRSLCV